MPSVELIAIGTEMLLGQLIDTNTPHVASQLAANGIDVYATHAIGDNRARIAAAMELSLSRADGVITTGGLGPTVDDLTKDAVCDVLGVGTELDAGSLARMEAFFAAMGRTMRENNRRQVELPQGSIPLANPHGTAPGILVFRNDGKFIACMPGVPAEMRPMLAQQLIPRLRERFELRDRIVTRVVHTINIAESEIDHRIDDLFRTLENPKIAVLAHSGQSDIKIMAKATTDEEAERLIAPVQAEVEERLRDYIYGYDRGTLDSAIHQLLARRGWWCATAESCTGGRIAAALTSAPGASGQFRGGIVAYDNAVKQSELDVSEAVLREHGAVSEQTAVAMARGACKRLNADIALATTGIAGPGGGSAEKPVGLVWFATVQRDGLERAMPFTFPGDRDAVQRRATTFALGLLWNQLKSDS